MQTYCKLAPWPAGFPRLDSRRADLRHNVPITADLLGLMHARRVADRENRIRNSFTTGTVTELMFVNTADYTAVDTTASEASLLAGVNEQPVIPAFFFFNKQGRNRCVRIEAEGILGTTSTPTLQFQIRFGTTAGSTFLSGTSVGISAAITTLSGVSNQWWRLRLDLQCNTAGIGTGNTTLSGSGFVQSPTGFASPFIYPLEPTTPQSATWTSVMDNALNQFVNLSVTWGTSSASNTIKCKSLRMFGLN